MHPQVIIKGLKQSLDLALKELDICGMPVNTENPEEKRQMLLKCASTALNSKLLASYQDHFAELVVSAVEKLDNNLLDKDLIGIKMVTGGSIKDSFLVNGVAFKKTFSYAGFE